MCSRGLAMPCVVWGEIDRERGSATVELAVVAPTLMLLILGVLQFGLWYHAQHVVQTAALDASRLVAAENGRVEDGESRAIEVVKSGLGSVADPTVEVAVSDETVKVRVQAEMRGLLPIPGLRTLQLSSEGLSYRERFRSPEDPA